MYLEHFQLDEAPFSITPDPRFVYLSERHRDGLAHLLYGVGQGGSGGFIQLTGEVGTGKTTLVRLLLEQLPEKTEVALVMNPRLDPLELVETICEELRLPLDQARGSLKRLVECLNAHLLERHAAGWRVIVLIDEAQDLSAEALEQVRLLTNLETAEQKLLQMILVGQPELKSLLAREDLRQLAQRITARFHLTPLDATETAEYVQHRLTVAGSTRHIFSAGALRLLYQHSQGIPRLINVIADRALLAAYVAGETRVQASDVRRGAREVLHGDMGTATGRRFWFWLAAAVLALVSVLTLVQFREGYSGKPSSATSATTHPDDSPPPELLSAGPSDSGSADNEPEVQLIAALQAARGKGSQTWTTWLALWGISDPETIDVAQACPERLANVWVCTRLSGNLGRLRAVNRPVLLKLTHEGYAVPALLMTLNETHASVELAGQRVLVARSVLERFWMGDYLALWQHPADIPVQVAQGAGRRAVAYLREQMQRTGMDLPRARHYASAWSKVVREFQQGQGLVADGIVGPETWWVLFSFLPEGPRLADGREHARQELIRTELNQVGPNQYREPQGVN